MISGISLGSIYAIIALGYTMVYGIAKMLNFAHGDVIMVGGYMCFCATTYLAGRRGWALCWLLLSAPRSVLLLRDLLQAAAYGAVAGGADHGHRRFVLSAECGAADLVLQPKTFTSVVTGDALSLFGGQLQISKVTLVAIAACVVIMVALMLFTGKSKVARRCAPFPRTRARRS